MNKCIFLLLMMVLTAGCSGESKYPKPENAFDAGREFIDGILKGDFERSAFYMLHDDKNDQYLNKLQMQYRGKSEHERAQYAEASINVLDIEILDTNTTIISYKNSYDQTARKLKVIRLNDDWKVDFKYTFDGNL